MRGLDHGKVALALCLFGLSQSGCDIVQGFREASSAVFPDEKTYFDAPGFRLVRGGFRDLEFASGSSLYLLGRPADREDSSLYVMRYADPRPCILPNVKAHSVGVGTYVDTTTIAYTEEGSQPGTLRFANGDCQTFDIALPSSTLPFIETPEGFLIYRGQDFVMVNPVAGTTRTVAESAHFFGSFAYFYVIESKGRLGAFKTDWHNVAWFGNDVVHWGGAGMSWFYEDATGIHKVSATSGESVSDTLIAADGCELTIPRPLGGSENWAAYYQPCADKKLVVYTESNGHTGELEIPGDPRALAFFPAHPSQGGDPAKDPFYIFNLTDFDVDKGLGTLVMRTPDHQMKKLGERVAFERLNVFASDEETHGFMLTDVDADVGTYARWETDGSQQVMAKNVVRGNGDLVTNFDGATGQFELLSDQGLSLVAQRVPANNFKMRDEKDRWTAVVDDFSNGSGSLYITERTLDFGEAARTPSPAPKLELIAKSVRWDSRTRFVPAVPGIAYFTSYDETNDIGRLEYRNLELRFTATISDGVADYLNTPGGLIYSVPYGDGAGIWVVRSR
jgi:hypothetical protein